MKIITGNDRREEIHEYDLNVWTIYLNERESYRQTEKHPIEEFRLVYDFIYRTQYLVTSHTSPEKIGGKQPNDNMPPSKIDELLARPTKLYSKFAKHKETDEPDTNTDENSELRVVDDYDPHEEHMKDYNRGIDRWLKLESESKFFGDTHFFAHNNLYLCHDKNGDNVDILIEKKDGDDFELYFAFMLRNIRSFEERKFFLNYWQAKYNGGFELFIDHILSKFVFLFDEAQKKTIPKIIDSLKVIDLPEVVNPIQVTNLPGFESIENLDEIKIAMKRELLTVMVHYYNKYHEISVKNHELNRFLSVLCEINFTKPDNSPFKNHVSKHFNAKYSTVKDIKILEEAAKLYDSVELSYISNFIRKDIEKVEQKINKNN